MALPINGFKPNNWRVPLPLLALGIYGLFGFHFLLFLSLRLAPPVATNLINYLWPLGIVVMAPLFLPSVTWRWSFAGAAVLGFGGAALAIVSGSESQAAVSNDTSWLGYALALGSAWIWASYSLLSKRATQLTTGHIGTFCMVSAAFALLCHVLLEPATSLSLGDLWRIALLGLGPLGGSFFFMELGLALWRCQTHWSAGVFNAAVVYRDAVVATRSSADLAYRISSSVDRGWCVGGAQGASLDPTA